MHHHICLGASLSMASSKLLLLQNRTKGMVDKECVMCHEVFDAKVHNAKCCSKACAKQKDKNYQKERRQRRKKQGKCRDCGVKHDRAGVLCEACSDKDNSSRNSRRQGNLANGLCFCGNHRDREGLIECSTCATRHATRASKARQWDKDHGMCPKCRQVNMDCNKFRLCAECRADGRKACANQRLKKKQQGRA